MIEVNNVTKKIHSGNEQIEILKNINLTIDKAEIVSIIGHSGSGKSSLLAIMSGIDPPDIGTVTVDDVNLYSLSENKLAEFRNQHFGIIFQNFNLISNLSADENVEIPRLLANKKNRKKVPSSELLDMVGMKEKRNVKVANLSGGEQQRVAIARALIQEPQILFADEPTGSLDYENTANILKLFQKIRDELNVSVILVTHDDYVAQNADRIIKLNYGIISV